MTPRENKKLLLAIDLSNYALEAVRYAGKMFSPQNTEFVIFHDHSKIPENYWDLERDGGKLWRIGEARAWEIENKKQMGEHLNKAKKILQNAGFPEEAIKIKTPKKELGIARDIVREARSGYSCVAVGRRGMSNLKDLALGSTSIKLLERIDFAPIIVVGKQPDPGAFLLALDGSSNSLRVVDFVGTMIGGSNKEISLIHVIRGDNKSFIKEAENIIKPVFAEARKRLIKSGFEPNQISSKIIAGAHSRAGIIFQEAKFGGYGTIVVGRRGLSKVREFFMGRVSNKLIHMAKRHATWVIS